MIRKAVSSLVLLVGLGTGIAYSDNTANSGSGLPQDVLDKITGLLAPGTKATSVTPVNLPPLYEVVVGGDVVYVSADGRYLLQGDLIDVKSRSNVTEDKRAQARRELLASVSESDMIVYPAAKQEHVLTVFTDIDCPYCRKMHQQMAEYNQRGITIRYMAFPRAGVGSESYHKAVAAWCAKDRRQAMTDAKGGKTLPPASADCKNPVKDQYELARRLGLQGTPALVLEDGTIVPGYVPPQQLAEHLNGGKKSSS